MLGLTFHRAGRGPRPDVAPRSPYRWAPPREAAAGRDWVAQLARRLVHVVVGWFVLALVGLMGWSILGAIYADRLEGEVQMVRERYGYVCGNALR